jgi:arginine utilization regulatory protein
MQNKKLSMAAVLSPAFIEIWENSLLGVMIIDENGIIRYMNRLLIRTDDLQDEKILGRKMTDFYPIKKGSHLSIQTIETLKSTIKKTIIYYTHKNKLVNSLCSSFPLFSGGKVEGALHFSLNLQTSQTLIDRYQNKNIRTEIPDQVQKTVFYTFDSIIGENIKIRDAVASAKSASLKDFSIFIWAETGCGKELFAQSIHNASARHDKPFVPINCAAIPENLLETTLFGTAKGAFTGAKEKAGLLEEAQGGTLLLDELNSMSFDLQAKLLRASQEKRIRRVGALKEIPVDVRFISTCNISPSQALKEKKIRTDLFYRLAVAVIEIPALRDHISDIPVLCTHFLKHWSKESDHETSSMKNVFSVSNETYEIFNHYPWPGNVRELEHTLKVAITLCNDGNIIEPRHLSKFFMDNFKQLSHEQRNLEPEKDMEKILENSTLPGLPEFGNLTDHEVLLDAQRQGKICLNNTMKNIETVYIKKALAKAGNNVSKAGRFLNLSPQALRYKLKQLGIHIPAE